MIVRIIINLDIGNSETVLTLNFRILLLNLLANSSDPYLLQYSPDLYCCQGLNFVSGSCCYACFWQHDHEM